MFLDNPFSNVLILRGFLLPLNHELYEWLNSQILNNVLGHFAAMNVVLE